MSSVKKAALLYLSLLHDKDSEADEAELEKSLIVAY